MSIPRGVASNNPGNIIKTGINWIGEKEGLPDDHFETFDTPEHGLEALCKLLLIYQTKHNLFTIRGIISRWAPPVENDTEAYIRAVVAEVGIAAEANIHLQVPETLANLCTAIVRHENGQQPYMRSMLLTAARTALGLVAPVAPILPPVPVPATIPAPPSVRPAEGLSDVPAAGLADLIQQFEAEGAKVSVRQQPNGQYTVTATYG